LRPGILGLRMMQLVNVGLKPSTDWEGKAYSTRVAYAYFLDHWISPRWDQCNLRDVRTIQ